MDDYNLDLDLTDDKTYSVYELMVLLNVSRNYILKLVKSGELKAFYIAKNVIRVRRSEYLKFIRKLEDNFNVH